MPTLTKQEADLFFKIFEQLVYFVNLRLKIIENFPKPKEGKWDLEDIQKISDKIFSNPEIITSFYSENPVMLNKEEIELVKSWKTSIKDKFIVFTNKGKTIFFSSEKEPKAYEVNGLYDDFFDMAPFQPIMVEATLIPFKEKIIYPSLFKPYMISFGAGYKRGLMTDFEISKNKFGIILSLTEPINEKKQSDEDLLRFYLKNKQNKEEFWEEIEDILKKNPLLKNIYHNEIGKSYARETKRIFSEIGIKDGWFAIVNSQVIASGKSESEVKERIKEILPEDKLSSAHIFKYEGKEKKGNEE
jgi:hypothetical protein